MKHTDGVSLASIFKCLFLKSRTTSHKSHASAAVGTSISLFSLSLLLSLKQLFLCLVLLNLKKFISDTSSHHKVSQIRGVHTVKAMQQPINNSSEWLKFSNNDPSGNFFSYDASLGVITTTASLSSMVTIPVDQFTLLNVCT